MVERLKSALKNPVSPLLFRASALAAAIFWLRFGDLGFLKVAVFLTAFLFLYFKPSVNAGKHLVSAAVLVLLIFLAPRVGGLIGFYLNLVLSGLGFLLLGVKNLIFIRRQGAYLLLHFTLMIGLASLFSLGDITAVRLFALLFLLVREFYIVALGDKGNLTNLITAVESMLLLQVAWVTSFFPTSFLVDASFFVLTAFVLHDSIVNHFKETFSRKLALRNVALFVALTLIIVSMPVWGFQ